VNRRESESPCSRGPLLCSSARRSAWLTTGLALAETGLAESDLRLSGAAPYLGHRNHGAAIEAGRTGRFGESLAHVRRASQMFARQLLGSTPSTHSGCALSPSTLRHDSGRACRSQGFRSLYPTHSRRCQGQAGGDPCIFFLPPVQTSDTLCLHKKGGDPVRIPLAIWTCEVIVT